MKRLIPAILAVAFLMAMQRQHDARAGAAAQPSPDPGSYALSVADGSLMPLGGPESTAVLSPDGAFAAVVTREGPDAGIRVIELATGGVSVPLASDQGQVSEPVWSPDGRRLAFRFERFGRPDPAALPPSGLIFVAPRTRETVAILREPPAIWTWGPGPGSITAVVFDESDAGLRTSIVIIRVEGEVVIDVGRREVTATLLEPSASICPTALAWSPDGRRLVFQGGAFRQGCGEAESLGLWLWDADSGSLRQLTHGAFYFGAAWTSDGRILSRRLGGFDQATSSFRPDAVVLVDVDGGEQVLAVTPATPFPFAPKQETAGQTVMFWQADCQEAAVFAVGLHGGEPRRLSEPGALALSPRLSPDGRSVAWVDARPDAAALRLAAVDGSGARTLASASPSIDLTGWSGDGRLLSFTAGTPALECPAA